MVYNDNILIRNETPERHTVHIWKIVLLLNCATALFNLKKCSIFTVIIDNLGQSIRFGKPEIAFHSTFAKFEVKFPINFIVLRSFAQNMRSLSTICPSAPANCGAAKLVLEKLVQLQLYYLAETI